MSNLVGIPCYNCSNQIVRVLKALEALPEKEFSKLGKIIVVDNRSSDGTIEKIIASIDLFPKVAQILNIFLNDCNYGLGGSHKVLFDIAINQSFENIIIIHGDDQADASEIPRLLSLCEQNNKSILGARFMKKSRLVNYQLSRIIGNRVLNLIFTLVTFKSILDLGSGLNIFKTIDLKSSNYLKLTNSFNFNCELLLDFISTGRNFQFESITWKEEDQISNAKNLKVALSMLKSLFRWRLIEFSSLKEKPSHSYTLVWEN